MRVGGEQDAALSMGRIGTEPAFPVDVVDDRPRVRLVDTNETPARWMNTANDPEYLHSHSPRQAPAGDVQETDLTAPGRTYSILITRVPAAGRTMRPPATGRSASGVTSSTRDPAAAGRTTTDAVFVPGL
jgi:hypothetical protein